MSDSNQPKPKPENPQPQTKTPTPTPYTTNTSKEPVRPDPSIGYAKKSNDAGDLKKNYKP